MAKPLKADVLFQPARSGGDQRFRNLLSEQDRGPANRKNRVLLDKIGAASTAVRHNNALQGAAGLHHKLPIKKRPAQSERLQGNRDRLGRRVPGQGEGLYNHILRQV